MKYPSLCFTLGRLVLGFAHAEVLCIASMYIRFKKQNMYAGSHCKLHLMQANVSGSLHTASTISVVVTEHTEVIRCHNFHCCLSLQVLWSRLPSGAADG